MADLEINVYDTITSSEIIYGQRIGGFTPVVREISVYDTITAKDTMGPYVGLITTPNGPPLYVTVYDSVALSDTITHKRQINIVVHDDVAITEYQNPAIPLHYFMGTTEVTNVTDVVEEVELIRGGWRDVTEEDDTWSDV